MTRQEAIEFIENNYICREWNNEKFKKSIEILKKQPTLAELLGWEECTEYILSFGSVYRIVHDRLEQKVSEESWCNAKVELTPASINNFRNAEKVENEYVLKHKFFEHNILSERESDKKLYLVREEFMNKKESRFTKKEIEEIKEKYNTDLSDYEILKVMEL